MSGIVKLRVKILLILVAFGGLTTAVSILYILYFTGEDNFNAVKFDSDRITEAIESIISDKSDVQNIEKELMPLIVSHRIIALILYDQAGKILYGYHEEGIAAEQVDFRQYGQYELHNNHFIRRSTLTNSKSNIIGSSIFILPADENEANGNAIRTNLLFLAFLLILLTLICFFTLLRIFIAPVEKIKDVLAGISEGNTDLELNVSRRDEMGEIAEFVRRVIKNVNHYLDEITNRQTELVTAIKDAETTKHELNIESDFMSQLHTLSNEYRRMKGKSEIFKRLGKDICQHFAYHAVLLYRTTENNISLYDAYFKNLTYLRDTYLIKYSNYIVPGDHPIYMIFEDHTPFFTQTPPCYEEIEKTGLSGHYAIVPLMGNARVWAVIAVGFLEKHRRVGPHDVEKLMLFLNTIGLTLDTIENVEDLEIAIRQRTEQLEKANLRLSRSMVEKNEFLRSISHDLNAPLRNIVGLIDSILRKYETELNTDLSDRLHRIRNNINKELELINELLELSRVKTRKIVTEKIDINEMIDQIIEKFQYDISRKNIIVEHPGDFPVLRYDRYTIRQIFQNLIDNAVKFIQADAENKQIKLDWQQNETHFVFSIMDTGIGIQEKEREKIFSIFYRGNNELNLTSQGKGIGLAMIKTLLENQDGEIWVESAPGEGSKFYFTIPVDFVNKETEIHHD